MVASEAWAKKTKVMERIKRSETTALWKVAMMPVRVSKAIVGVEKGYIAEEPPCNCCKGRSGVETWCFSRARNVAPW